jgi:hypothetical protein
VIRRLEDYRAVVLPLPVMSAPPPKSDDGPVIAAIPRTSRRYSAVAGRPQVEDTPHSWLTRGFRRRVA